METYRYREQNPSYMNTRWFQQRPSTIVPAEPYPAEMIRMSKIIAIQSAKSLYAEVYGSVDETTTSHEDADKSDVNDERSTRISSRFIDNVLKQNYYGFIDTVIK